MKISFYSMLIIIFFFSGCSSIKEINMQQPFSLKQDTTRFNTKQNIYFKENTLSQYIIDEFDDFLKKEIFTEYKENGEVKKTSNSYLIDYKKISKFRGNTNE